MLGSMSSLGLSVDRLALTASRMGMAKAALERSAREAARQLSTVTAAGDIEFQGEFWDLDEEIKLRLASQAVRFVSGSEYRPRLASLRKSLESAKQGRAATLSGCTLFRTERLGIGIRREFSACEGRVPINGVWDGRWTISGGDSRPGAETGALGDHGILQCPDWRDSGLSRSSLIATPAVWKNSELCAAPVAGRPNGWSATLLRGGKEFLNSFAVY